MKFIKYILSIFWPISIYVSEVVASLNGRKDAWFLEISQANALALSLNPQFHPELYGPLLILTKGGVDLYALLIDAEEPQRLNWRERNLLREAVFSLLNDEGPSNLYMSPPVTPQPA